MGGVILFAASAALAFALTGCSSSRTADSRTSGSGGANDVGGDGAALGPSSSGLALAERYNLLIEQNYDLRCKVCPCNGFSPGSDACLGVVFDQLPALKPQVLCQISASERYGACLTGALDCTATTPCDTAHASDLAKCPDVQVDAAAAVLPPACIGS